MITREQAVYKITRVREIVGMIERGETKTMDNVSKINLMQELREIRRDLIDYRRENPNA